MVDIVISERSFTFVVQHYVFETTQNQFGSERIPNSLLLGRQVAINCPFRSI